MENQAIENTQPAVTQTLEKTATANNKEIMDIKIERNGNIKIRIKVAGEIEKFFKENGSIRTATNTLGTAKTMKYYNLDSGNRELAGLFRVNDINERLISENCINSAILRLVGISEGIELAVNQLISKDALADSVKIFKEGLITFYKRYINPIHISSTLTINEI